MTIMKISLISDDGTVLFDMFHYGNIVVDDAITLDTIKINNDKDKTEIIVNGNQVYPIKGEENEV